MFKFKRAYAITPKEITLNIKGVEIPVGKDMIVKTPMSDEQRAVVESLPRLFEKIEPDPTHTPVLEEKVEEKTIVEAVKVDENTAPKKRGRPKKHKATESK